ncbi:hypothetical protein [Mycobacteroides salmoniphilum]|uniref:hypothetical protein n=1 Tax=Mycobacteroides salmoniphilum TaxID=404941 RepID=UPI0010664718|nr:hypothetical protein [Mycobacteroides salmoniphilum]
MFQRTELTERLRAMLHSLRVIDTAVIDIASRAGITVAETCYPTTVLGDKYAASGYLCLLSINHGFSTGGLTRCAVGALWVGN